MSTQAHTGPEVHADGAAAHHGDHAHGSLRGYLIGFGLSVLLTAIPFWIVMAEPFASKQVAGFAVMGFAAVQIVVHMVYFLHMNTHSDEGWTMMALIFTIIILVIVLSGSLWVMYHLNANMMPPHVMDQMK
ncbi:cytochrome o ubiquinol oxidase subunit IV [Chelatococcus reniformis]|uniref:Cytochrome bo(3) ubiquinol oxidase subunit 4 n=1 Tax=Chelatococcus reniformis TaxID=1494448 RepID=A0A916X7X2_9HYPH|nr:cytochrome o ubiquinol oxidase subunit IV [Chelatococcus reniformis]GGC48800.1 cytochrome o ubiquinol oxidase subunit IV [Chelatococcus reniformis]